MKFLFFFFIAAVPALLRGQDACKSYVGKTVVPVTFDAAIAPFQRLTPKGEFESTAQYRARRDTTLRGSLGPVVIAKQPEDRKFFVYDADAQQLRISKYAFSNNQMVDMWSALHSAGLDTTLHADRYFNVHTILSSTDQLDGTYEATNGFGAHFTVTKIKRHTKAILKNRTRDRSVGDEDDVFATKDEYLGSLLLNPTEAQALKPTLRLALVVVPKEPFLVGGSYQYQPGATMSNPHDVTEQFSILVADFKCGVVMNADDKVLAAYPMQ